jgi:pyruvate/2-oxoglutarate dehydrogenase complex dihydrolipoamide dehydrogenase (E3) component
MCGEAAFVDPHRIRVTGTESWREISAANILIASGTRAVPPSNI